MEILNEITDRVNCCTHCGDDLIPDHLRVIEDCAHELKLRIMGESIEPVESPSR